MPRREIEFYRYEITFAIRDQKSEIALPQINKGVSQARKSTGIRLKDIQVNFDINLMDTLLSPYTPLENPGLVIDI